MQLKRWLTLNSINQRQFARSIGLKDSHLSRICLGTSASTPEVVDRIQKATNGEVCACDIHKHYLEVRDTSRPAPASTENDKPASSPTAQANTLA